MGSAIRALAGIGFGVSWRALAWGGTSPGSRIPASAGDDLIVRIDGGVLRLDSLVTE
jgi:hypothetical protein